MRNVCTNVLPFDCDPMWNFGLQHARLELLDRSRANRKPPPYEGFSHRFGNSKKTVATYDAHDMPQIVDAVNVLPEFGPDQFLQVARVNMRASDDPQGSKFKSPRQLTLENLEFMHV